MSDHDLIDEYLDALMEALRGPGHLVRRALAESEDHLREAAARAEKQGTEAVDAQRAAIAQFGPVEMVARRYRLEALVASRGQVFGQATLALLLVGALCLMAIGLSGVAAAVGGALVGKEFISGDGPGVVYTPDRCADFLEYFPGAAGCSAAAVAHHYDEVVSYRLAAGILGLIVLVAWWLLRRVWLPRLGPVAIPRAFAPIAGTALFAAAAAVLLGMGGMQLVFTGVNAGPGNFLSAGLVSAVAAGSFLVRLVGELRKPELTQTQTVEEFEPDPTGSAQYLHECCPSRFGRMEETRHACDS